LFGSSEVPAGEQGLYVLVREGHVEITSGNEVLDLGRGEAGFASDSGNVARPPSLPLFLEFDRTPRPDSRNPMLQTVLGETLNRPASICR